VLYQPPGPRKDGFGPQIAFTRTEEGSQPMRMNDSPMEQGATPSSKAGCEEHNRLLDEFGVAIHDLIRLHEQQFQAVIEGDTECHRFDVLIHMANERKQLAKYAYLRHVEAHGCSDTHGAN
jgi:hypothetical protein